MLADAPPRPQRKRKAATEAQEEEEETDDPPVTTAKKARVERRKTVRVLGMARPPVDEEAEGALATEGIDAPVDSSAAAEASAEGALEALARKARANDPWTDEHVRMALLAGTLPTDWTKEETARVTAKLRAFRCRDGRVYTNVKGVELQRCVPRHELKAVSGLTATPGEEPADSAAFENVLGARVQRGDWQYLVRWADIDEEDPNRDQWVPEANFANAQAMTQFRKLAVIGLTVEDVVVDEVMDMADETQEAGAAASEDEAMEVDDGTQGAGAAASEDEETVVVAV